jgi:hypothetical protein
VVLEIVPAAEGFVSEMSTAMACIQKGSTVCVCVCVCVSLHVALQESLGCLGGGGKMV